MQLWGRRGRRLESELGGNSARVWHTWGWGTKENRLDLGQKEQVAADRVKGKLGRRQLHISLGGQGCLAPL